uniref:Exocyst complex component n=1 Tax=Petromyzon marinus TaxID=7757 RepID=A0AAJ7SWS4_PETMA|nr:exocyst complex component 6B-like isoform X3 [Petromyzon marinus]
MAEVAAAANSAARADAGARDKRVGSDDGDPTAGSAEPRQAAGGIDAALDEVCAEGVPLESTIRAVYDGQHRGELMSRLDVRIRGHDRDIEKLCNFHYQGFVDCITELLSVRAHALKLKDHVVESNQKMQEAGRELVHMKRELVRTRRQQRNVLRTLEQLAACLPVLETYAKLQQQMEAKRFYPALRTLQQLESCLPALPRYRFCAAVRDGAAALRGTVRGHAAARLRDFLERAQEQAEALGEAATVQAQKQQRRAESRNIIFSLNTNRAPKATRSNSDPEDDLVEEDEAEWSAQTCQQDFEEESVDDNEEEEEPMQELLDFSALYSCMLISSVLGDDAAFQTYYRQQRREQVQLVSQPPCSSTQTLDSYRKYFNQIVGFFVVEERVLCSTRGLVERLHLLELWDSALTRVLAAVRTLAQTCCSEPELLRGLKELLISYADTMQGLGVPVQQLLSLLHDFRAQYGEALHAKWATAFQTILDGDSYSPVNLASEEECARLVIAFPLSSIPTVFPASLPFSPAIPAIYTQVQEFVKACLHFSEDLHLSTTELDDMLRRSTNQLLTRALAGSLMELATRPSLGLMELVQLSVNIGELEQSLPSLTDFISGLTGMATSATHNTLLYASDTFKDARRLAEESVELRLVGKVDEFVSLAEYAWAGEEPTGRASSYLLDLLTFLRSIFSLFSCLPRAVAKAACMACCKHLAASLLSLLLGASGSRLSAGALQQLSLDLMQCEVFACSGPVPGFEDGSLALAFLDLRQLLDLFLDWDWAEYLADYGKPHARYLRVDAGTALTLLERMRHGRPRQGGVSQLRGAERDEVALYHSILQQLRAVAAGLTPAGRVGEALSRRPAGFPSPAARPAPGLAVK